MSSLNLNKTFLGGRLTSDVELKQTTSGVSVCQFTIAVNRKQTGEGEKQADFINCVAWRSTAEFISRYFSKGSAILVCGSIQTRSWEDQNGQKRYATEVLVNEASFVDSKAEAQGAASPTFTPTPSPNFEEVTDDDNLPF